MANIKRTLREAKADLAPPKPYETPNEKFRRLANFRAKRVINDINSLARLGSPLYERSAEQIDTIERALRAALDECIKELRRGQPKERVEDII